MISYVEYLFVHLLAILYSLFEKISTQFFSKLIFLNIISCRRERCDKTIALVRKTAWLLIVQREAET